MSGDVLEPYRSHLYHVTNVALLDLNMVQLVMEHGIL